MTKVKVKPHPQTAEITAEKLEAGSYALFRNIIAEISARERSLLPR